MVKSTSLTTLMNEHVEHIAAYADIFARVAPEAVKEQEAFFQTLGKSFDARHKLWSDQNTASASAATVRWDDTSNGEIKWLKQLWSDSQKPVSKPSLRVGSRLAQAATFQPVRDMIVGDIIVIEEDRKLEVIGPPFAYTWTHKSGNAFPTQHTVWVDPTDGSLGFDHQIDGNGDGRQANSGAAIYVRFIPRIAPGIAQIRPYVPYSYQWLNISFYSREDNRAKFGVRIWSWDSGGGDLVIEQDYTYFIWNDTSIARWFAYHSSPSWEEDQANSSPEWDYDNAFLYGKDAPYFRTRSNRIYMAAIWCFGMCFSVANPNEDRPGSSTGRLHAKIPWVVIGYQ